MWLAGAVGVTAALGYYLIALAVAVFAVIVLATLRAFSHRVISGNNPRLGQGTETDRER
jgi:putative Mg2+ transporter-C (MgtC) family protein